MKRKTLFWWQQKAKRLGKNVEDMRYDAKFSDIIPTSEQASEQMHPVVKALYEGDYAHKHSFGYYETLSEMVKAFSHRVWLKKSWEYRMHRVPELRYWSKEKRLQLEEMFLSL